MSTSISATTSPFLANSTASERIPTKTLGQEDFLKLLVTKMSQQDPLNPKDETDFIAEMAQFTSLEQTKGLVNSMQTMQASSLLGRVVEVQPDNQETITGKVSAVIVEAGTPKVIVGENEYALDQIRVITPENTSTVIE